MEEVDGAVSTMIVQTAASESRVDVCGALGEGRRQESGGVG